MYELADKKKILTVLKLLFTAIIKSITSIITLKMSNICINNSNKQ